MRPEVVYNLRVTQLSCTGKNQLDVFRKCGVFNYIQVGKKGFCHRRIKEIRMVVLMDIAAEGDGNKGRCNEDSRSEETTRDRCLMLGNLIPSTIPNSLIYRYEDFISKKIANGFYGDIFKVRMCLELRTYSKLGCSLDRFEIRHETQCHCLVLFSLFRFSIAKQGKLWF